MKKLKLPNGEEIYYIDKLTALDVYEEINEENDYLPHGISVKDGDVIFDVGANIGLFSRFIAQQANGLQIFTFEPVPAIFKVLEANLSEIPADIKNYNIGLGEKSERIEINFYPRVSADSAIVPFNFDFKVQQYLENYKEVVCQNMPIARIVPKFLRKRVVKSSLRMLYKSEKVSCQIRTLSEIIQENKIERIDYLKVDAENYEKQVLAGIMDEDWEKIQQVAMEVHEHIEGGENLLEEINELLKKKGFKVTLDRESRFSNMGVHMLYAKKNKKNNF